MLRAADNACALDLSKTALHKTIDFIMFVTCLCVVHVRIRSRHIVITRMFNTVSDCEVLSSLLALRFSTQGHGWTSRSHSHQHMARHGRATVNCSASYSYDRAYFLDISCCPVHCLCSTCVHSFCLITVG